MSSIKNYDVVIIGGGASGIMCAISAKINNRNISVAIIEKNDRIGKKLMSTGNGRCNLTNRDIQSNYYFGSFTRQNKSIFECFTTDKLLDIFKNLGLLSFCDSDGRYYPISKQASSVLDVLRFACEKLNVEIMCNENIKSVRKKGNAFTIKTDNFEYNSKKLVVANGSKSAPKLGGNGSGADILKNFGHSFTPFSPALCPIKVNSNLLKSLKGIRSVGSATLLDKNKNILATESGEIQFTETALSGICLFNLSLYSKKDYYISLDLMNNTSEKELFDVLLQHKKQFSNATIDNLFTGIFIKRLGQAILKMSGVSDFSRNCSSLNDGELKKIAKTIKNMEFTVIENCGFDQSQCSLGGVVGKEIDEKTMQSKLVKGLFICGEVIDICGKCGGYNLHFAFSSGYIAGENL